MPENVSGAKRVAAGKRQRGKKERNGEEHVFLPKTDRGGLRCLCCGSFDLCGVSAMDKAGVSTDGILSSKPTLTVWYTEEKLEDYLSAMALEYQDAIGVRVVPV